MSEPVTIPDKANIGEKYGPAMGVTDPVKAQAYFEALVEHNMGHSEHDRTEAESIERQNLGYFAGYYDHETRVRIERLFICEHPVFGRAEDTGPISPATALAAGADMASRGEPR